MSEFIWSQTALKDLEKSTTCPTRWKHFWIDKEWKTIPSAVQNYGNYFEYLCINRNAKGDPVTDLPHTQKGDKTAVQKRIERQAAKFKDLVDPFSKSYVGFEVLEAQVRVEGEIDGIKVGGDIDFIALDTNTGEKRIVDLKLTEDAFAIRSQYSWGNPIPDLDLIQQVLYSELYYQQHGERLPTTLMVFEHGTDERVKIIDLDISDNRVLWCRERFIKGNEVVNLYNTHGWTTDPSDDECESCQVKNCVSRKIPQNIYRQQAKY